MPDIVHDGSMPDVVAWDAEVNSLVVALTYAADLRGDTELGNDSLTHKFCDAFCETVLRSRDDQELRERMLSGFTDIITAREGRNAVGMLTALRKLQEDVGVIVIPDAEG